MSDNKKNEFEKYSSKIKNVYIELQNYTFFHRPSGVDAQDKRFIGRVKVKEKLKAILSFSETKSGAYLITGFRGMGKTSVVNKVIAELKGKDNDSPGFYRYARIFLAIFFFSLFDVLSVFSKFQNDNENKVFLLVLFYLIPAILLVSSINYFLTESFQDRNESNNSILSRAILLKKIRKIPELLYFKKSSSQTSSFLKVLCQDYFIASIIHFIGICFLLIFFTLDKSEDSFHYYEKFQAYIAAYIVVVFLSRNWKSISKDLGNFKVQIFFIFLFFVCLILFAVVGYNFLNSTIESKTIRSVLIIHFQVTLLILDFIFILCTICKQKDLLKKFDKPYLFNLSFSWIVCFFVFIYYIYICLFLEGVCQYSHIDSCNISIATFLISLLCTLFIFVNRKSISISSSILFIFLTAINFLSITIFPNNTFWFYIYLLFLTVVSICTIVFSYKSFLFRKEVVTFFNHSHLTEIKINLGQENLNEKDILRLIAKSIHTKYIAICSPFYSLRRFSWVFVYVLVSYVIALTLFYYKPTYKIINDFRVGNGFSYFFPSQHLFIADYDLLKDSEKIGYSNEEYRLEQIEEYERDSAHEFSIETYYNYISQDQIDTISENSDSTSYKEIVKAIKSKQPSYRWYEKIFCSSQTHYLAVHLDYLIYVNYNEISQFIFEAIPSFILDKESNREVILLNKTLDIHENFHLLPPRLDYLFIIFLILFFQFMRLLSAFKITGISHQYILRRLQRLIDGIDASIAQEQSKRIGRNKGLFFERKLQKIFPITAERDIENELINILNECDRIAAIRLRPKFIFIFDELDKIEPTGKYRSPSGQEESLDTYTTEGTRKREEAIGRILSNLKHFFNTAKAKFIFIAGREMYDAALADISDRDSLIGSIFHDVLYVPSFYQDPFDNKLSDISSMTERYLCQFLIPDSFLKKESEPIDRELSLRNYNKYLKEKIIEQDTHADAKRAKIIFTLQNFITYLTYRSNGSPKKITKLLEEYIFPINDYKGIEDEIIASAYENKLYLHFTYYDQYVFGFSNYMFNPFLLSVSKYLKDFGDKLLVSTSFLLNHIYKYHGTGFSFRTLELTPEIIAINKAPELRSFIERLLLFLSNTHIREILSGLHQFKFNSKIEREIAFISRISEKESAAYNFTLDESLEIKRLYRRRLQEARAKYAKSQEYFDASIAYLNHILGDLHYHDQEYDRAIIYYKDAVQYIHKEASVFKRNIVFYTRNMLKLGMTYEKKRSYDDALSIYENLKYEIERFAEEFYKDNVDNPIKSNAATALRLIYQPILAELQLIEKHSIKSITKHYLRKNIKQFDQIIQHSLLKPEQSFLLKVEYLDKIGDLLYYKNGLLFGERLKQKEKKNITVIETYDSKDFKYSQEKKISKTEHKINTTHIFSDSGNYDSFKSIYTDHKSRLKYFPISAYKYYMKSLEELLQVVAKENFNNKRENIFDISRMKESEIKLLHLYSSFYHKAIGKEFPVRRKAIYMALGNCLSDVGDCMLSFYTLQESIDFPIFPMYRFIKNRINAAKLNIILDSSFDGIYSQLNTLTLPLGRNLKIEYNVLSPLERTLRFVYCAAMAYLRAGDIKEYSFQMTKILHIINEVNKDQIVGNVFSKLKDLVVTKAIRNIYRAYESTNQVEIEKFKTTFNIKDDDKLLRMIYNNTAASADVREIIILYKEIELKLVPLPPGKNLKIEDCFITQYTSINNNYNRLRELVYKSKFNFKILKQETGITNHCKIDTRLEKIEDYSVDKIKKDRIKYLILDSIFCLNEMIKKLNIYGVSYIHNHFWLATSYHKLGEWCKLYHRINESTDIQISFDKEIVEKLLGKMEVLDLAPYNIYEKAIRHYYSVKETHSEGGAYKNMLENMYYLDDSFNDNLYHFCAALERRQLNTGRVEKYIQELKKKNDSYATYDINKYF